MQNALFAPVCAITRTRRRRFLWAAWWTSAPTESPFSKPDAFAGGARSREEALSAAERAAGCKLIEIEGSWARAWANLLVGQPPFASTAKRAANGGARAHSAQTSSPARPSVWHVLGLPPNATLDEIKRAYRLRALETHPDRGGTDEAFRALQNAYESALDRRRRPRKAR